jgi:hypothetical protein
MASRPRPRLPRRHGPPARPAAPRGAPWGCGLFTAALALLLAGVGPAFGQGDEEPRGGTPVELDRLLQLPSSKDYTVERRGGRTAGEWRRRFAELHDALAGERAALDDAERRLDELAGSTENWKVAPILPGVGAPADEAPLDYGLRQEIRRHREEIERLERQLRELEIEADLAGVPPSWQGRPADPGETGAEAPPAPAAP